MADPVRPDPRVEAIRRFVQFGDGIRADALAALDGLADDLAAAQGAARRMADTSFILVGDAEAERVAAEAALEAARNALGEILSRASISRHTRGIADIARKALAAGSVAPPDGDTARELCDGSSECPATRHVHGCYADKDHTACDDPVASPHDRNT